MLVSWLGRSYIFLNVTLSGQGGLFTGPILGLDKTVLIVGLGNLSNVLSGAIRTGPKGKY